MLKSAWSFFVALLVVLTDLHISTASPITPAPNGLAIGQIRRHEDSPNVGKRGEMPCQEWTELVGDGNPHQNYLHTQLTETITCDPSNTCQASYTKGYSISWSVSGGIEYRWISGGFEVGEERSMDQDYQCGAGPGDVTCVWYNTAHTAYTVRNRYRGGCLQIDTTPYVIFSPNKDNSGGGYYCVVGAQDCRTIYSKYWDYSGRAGGP